MKQNKTTPLSEKAVSIGDIDYEDNSVSKRFFRKEDVREAVRRLIGEVHKRGLDNFVGLREDGVDIKEQIPTLSNFVKEIFGKELCSDDSQQPRIKQTRGGELKSDEGLHSTDNGSSADIVSKGFLGGYAEFWDNPEDNRWDKEEEKQDE